MAISLSEAKNLKYGNIIYCNVNKNSDGSPQRWRVNGKVKTWKRNPERVEIPIKHGLRTFSYLTEMSLNLFDL